MPNYELTYVLRPLEEANFTSTNDRINTVLKNAGAEIVARNDWGRRRLAYPIQKTTDGYYTTLYVIMPGTAVRGVERALQLNDDVLRYLVVRVDEFRLPTPPPAAPTPEPAAAPAAAEESAAQAANETTKPAAQTTAPAAAADTIEAAPVAVSSTAATEGS